MVLCTVSFVPALRELADLFCAQCLFSIACNNLAQWLKTTSKFMKRYACVLRKISHVVAIRLENPKGLECDLVTSILHRRRYACAQCWRGNSCI